MQATGYGSTVDAQQQQQQQQQSSVGPSARQDGCMVRFVRWYIGVLFYLRYPLLLTWGLLILVAAVAGANLTDNLSNNITPPPDSPAAIANAKYAAAFPGNVNTTQYLIYVDSNGLGPINLGLSAGFKAFDTMFEYWLMTGRTNLTNTPEDLQYMDSIVGAVTFESWTNVSVYSSFRTMERQGFYNDSVFDYLGAGNFSTLEVVVVDYLPGAKESMNFYYTLRDKIEELLELSGMAGKITVTPLGMPSFVDEIGDASGRDVVVMFGVVVPLAMLIFCVSLDSLRMGILALCSLITTLLGSFAILDAIARSVEINSVTPGIVGALSIALSSDFTYMMCSKFRREVVLESAHFFDDPSGVTRGVVFVDPKHVMVMVLAYAGRVVAVTGTSVAFASLGLACFPLSTFSSIGIGCIICAMLASLTSLVLTPTLLVTFYRFFATGAEHCEWPTFFGGMWGAVAASAGAGGTYGVVGGGSGQNSEALLTSASDQQLRGDSIDNNKAATGNNNIKDATTKLVIPAASAPSFTGSNFSANGPLAAANNSGGNPQQQQAAGVSNNNTNQNQHLPSTGSGGSGSGSGGAGGGLGSPSSPIPRRRQQPLPAGMFMPTNVNLSREAVSRAELQLHDKRVFYRDFTAFLSQPVVAVTSILIVLGICIYPMTRAFDGVYSNAMEQFVPRDSALVPAWKSMRKTFRAADLFPYNVIIEWDLTPEMMKYNVAGNIGLGHQTYFNQGQDMLAELNRTIPNFYPYGISSPWWDQHLLDSPWGYSPNLTSKEVLGCVFKVFPPSREKFLSLNNPYCKWIIVQWGLHVAPNASVYVQDIGLNNRILPTSAEGMQYIRDMRKRLPEIAAFYKDKVAKRLDTWRYGGNVTMYLRGYGADSLDLVDFAMDRLVLVVGVLIGCAWLVVTLFFFSLGASIRLLLSLCFTLLTCFGFATIVFCDGLMANWSVPDGLKGTERAEAWLVPFAAIVLNLATVLNYDVSATIRVQQFRHMGIATRSAIVIAAIEGSNEVFVAAVMTMVSFAGLLFSQVPVMNQLGFFFIMGAFLQGIVFRLFLVVPVMALLGELNWFPYMQIAERCEGGGAAGGGFLLSAGGTTDSGALGGGGGSDGYAAVRGGDPATTTDSTAVVPRMSGLLAPPMATAAIEDNEALMWAARESGLDARRFSSALHAGYAGTTGTGGGGGRYAGSGLGGRYSRGGSNSLGGSQARPPLEFVFTQGGTSTNFGAAQQQQQQPSTSSPLMGGGSSSQQQQQQPPVQRAPSGMRSSLVPGEEQDASSMSSLAPKI